MDLVDNRQSKIFGQNSEHRHVRGAIGESTGYESDFSISLQFEVHISRTYVRGDSEVGFFSVYTGSAKETAKKIDDADEVPAYSQENVQLNMRIIYYRYVGEIPRLIFLCSSFHAPNCSFTKLGFFEELTVVLLCVEDAAALFCPLWEA